MEYNIFRFLHLDLVKDIVFALIKLYYFFLSILVILSPAFRSFIPVCLCTLSSHTLTTSSTSLFIPV